MASSTQGTSGGGTHSPTHHHAKTQSLSPEAAKAVLDQAKRQVGVDDLLRYYRILETLRRNDLQQLTSLLATHQYPPNADFGTPLHIACTLSPEPTAVDIVLQKCPHFLNTQDGKGNTPLHLAVKGGRKTIVARLLKESRIDDTILNKDGETPLDIAKARRFTELASLLQATQQAFVQQTCSHLQQHAPHITLQELKQLWDSSSRVATLIDINVPDSEGRTLLHHAVHRGDVEMCEWLLQHHADANIRDPKQKGKLAAEIAKNEKIKALLKGAMLRPSSPMHALGGPTTGGAGGLSSLASTKSPQLTGMIQKWTNYTSGYKTRFFTLSNAILSYYRSSADFPHLCRGSISLKVARIIYDYRQDPLRFQVLGRGSIKYTLRALNEAEAKKWVVALTEAKQWLQEKDRSSESLVDGASLHAATDDNVSHKSGRASAKHKKAEREGSPSHSSQHTTSVATLSTQQTGQGALFGDSSAATTATLKDAAQKVGDEVASSLSRMHTATPSLDDDGFRDATQEDFPIDHDDDRDDDVHSVIAEASAVPDETLSQLIAGLNMCLTLHEQLVVSLTDALPPASPSKAGPNMVQTVASSLCTLREAVVQLTHAQQKSTVYYKRKYEAAEEERGIWEAQLKSLALEHEALERTAMTELHQTRLDSQILRARGNTDASMMSLEEAEETENDQQFYDAVDEYTEQRKNILSKSTAQVNEDVAAEAKEAVALPSDGFQLGASLIGYPERPRLNLPRDPNAAMPSISLWSVLKNNLGKDLTKIALPVFFNEPTSMLQRLSEDVEYSELLDMANAKSDPAEQMQFVLAFGMSNYSSTIGRAGKPFNPLLGETYEYVSRDRQFRYIAEQPISACHCESPHYIFWSDSTLETKFNGKSMSIIPKGHCHVILKSTGHHYSWKKVVTSVQNIIVGTLYVDHYGVMEITNHSTGHVGRLKFIQRGWRGQNACVVEGGVYANAETEEKLFTLNGKWSDTLTSKKTSADPNADDQRLHVIWKRHDLPEHAAQNWNLTHFAISLNECSDELAKVLAPSDARFRPDQRAMEKGQFDLADEEKARLEEKQRTGRRQRAANDEEWQPLWFKLDIDPDTNHPHWVFNGDYWRHRAEGNWSTCPDLY